MSVPIPVSPTLSERSPATNLETGAILLGQVKWFGGVNNSTGRENHFGFVEANGTDFYVHRSALLSPQNAMIEGAEVLFQRLEERSGKPAATAVRVLSAMSSGELVTLLREAHNPTPDLVLTIALIRKELAPFRNEAFRAVSALGETNSSILGRFWNYFPPSGPSDRFYALAPDSVKSQVCKKHYSAVRDVCLDLLTRRNEPPTAIPAREIYEDLDDRDREIAALWAGGKGDAIVAQMLSARAAEKAVARLYRGAGAIIDDIAITQLDRNASDWLTHDLSVDSKISIDVKNARRPINSSQFYVEHTVPRFKLDRSGSEVRIAGVLSPYLQKHFIDDPRSIGFRVDDIVLLGETSRHDIDDFIARYWSPNFQVVRGNGRTFPNWVFGYPERWYPGLRDRMQYATDLCRDIPVDDWRYIFDSDELDCLIVAFCAMRMSLPSAMAGNLSKHQAELYVKLQRNLREIPNVPDIFLSLISDFVEAVIKDRQDYSPIDCNQILFSKRNSAAPLGAIDPLNLVASLVKTLASLWQNRSDTALRKFTHFRFGGLGLLQGRRNDDAEWTTILAYCGGAEYQRGEDGEIRLSEAGRPTPKGKCGHTPLVVGVHQTCPNCRKLLCNKCDFCSVTCQEQAFLALTRDKSSVAPSLTEGGGRIFEAPPWEFMPLEAYKDDIR